MDFCCRVFSRFGAVRHASGAALLSVVEAMFRRPRQRTLNSRLKSIALWTLLREFQSREATSSLTGIALIGLGNTNSASSMFSAEQSYGRTLSVQRRGHE